MNTLADIDLTGTTPEEFKLVLKDFSLHDLIVLNKRVKCLESAREKQLTPEGDWWTTWLILAGRGFGKTRTGAEDICWYAISHPRVRCGIIAPTSGDIRDTCIEGVSGILACLPTQMIKSYNRTISEVILVNDSVIKGFSAQEPDRLRGPQHHRMWCDELAAWDKAEEVWDMMMFGLRLGQNPQVIITTTPKPTDLIRRLVEEGYSDDGSVLLTQGSTYENKDNLAPTFFDAIAQYEGTQLGRQELYAELLDPEEGGIVKRSWFNLWPSDKPFPEFTYVVQSYDTAFTEKTTNDPTACTVWGVFKPQDKPWSVMLIDAWSERLTYPDLKPRVIDDYSAIYGEPGKKVDLVLIEDKGSGISLIQDLQRAGLFVRAYNPGKADKVQRLHVVSNIIQRGRVYIPESTKWEGEVRDWAQQFIGQVCSFPQATHDDYVDTMTQALRLLRDMNFLNIDPEPVDMDMYIDESKPRRVNPYAI